MRVGGQLGWIAGPTLLALGAFALAAAAPLPARDVTPEKKRVCHVVIKKVKGSGRDGLRSSDLFRDPYLHHVRRAIALRRDRRGDLVRGDDVRAATHARLDRSEPNAEWSVARLEARIGDASSLEALVGSRSAPRGSKARKRR